MTTNSASATIEPPGEHAQPAQAVEQRSQYAARLNLLRQPAYLPISGVLLTTLQRLWLRYWIDRTQSALAAATGRAVVLTEVTEQDRRRGAEVVVGAATGVGMTLRHVEHQEFIRLECDADACRAIADAMLSQLIGVRGNGPVSGEEQGVVEFVLLDVLASITADEPCLAGLHVERIGTAPEVTTAEPAFTLQLTLGGARGAIRIFADLRRLPSGGEPPLPVDQPFPDDAPVVVGVGLPAMQLPFEDFTALRPGDFLLPGATSLAGYAAACELLTETGWSIAAGRVTGCRATGVSIVIDAFRLRVPPADPCGALVTLVPLLGRREASACSLQHWQPGTALDLAVDGHSPIRLLIAGSEAGRCEIVMLEDELALRVLELKGLEHEFQR